jgi:hypothetical protein
MRPAWAHPKHRHSEIDHDLAGKYAKASVQRAQTTEKCGPLKMFMAF